ncbi:GNAT family N-acetyltransferase [Ornithinimicrobium murale]|uniref:GNAT family N-acetyltransferase n=1 Tax=Ornithinimicrobium murale TaxID=1050153 RepID=UPI0013B3BA17|nr:GNAT family N-acetyltransferase [Ornithinimicrobium murale]
MSTIVVEVLRREDPTGFRRAHRLVRAYLSGLHGDLRPNRLTQRHAQVLLDLASTRRSVVALASVGDRDVGVALLYPEPDVAELAVLYTAPAYRRAGVATALLRELLGRDVFPVSATVEQQDRAATALAASLDIYPTCVQEPGRLRFELTAPHQRGIAATRS